VSLLHAHLVFLTTYRRAMFTDTMRAACAEVDAELV